MKNHEEMSKPHRYCKDRPQKDRAAGARFVGWLCLPHPWVQLSPGHDVLHLPFPQIAREPGIPHEHQGRDETFKVVRAGAERPCTLALGPGAAAERLQDRRASLR